MPKMSEADEATQEVVKKLNEMTVLDVKITATGLAGLLREQPIDTIVVDVRPFTDFNKCHVKSAHNAFFAKMVQRRLFNNKIEPDCLISHLSTTCRTMNETMDVVLYGEEEKPRDCKRKTQSLYDCESPAKLLRVLKEKLEETRQFKSVTILEGGFKPFATAYPQLCESNEEMTRLPQSLSQPCLAQSGEEITQVLPCLFLGSQKDSQNSLLLKQRDITAVINLSLQCPKSTCITDEQQFLRIPVNDSYQDKLYPYFEECFFFIEKMREQGKKVLIHCLAGISRSPTLCISYIMRHKHMTVDDAYKFVKERRTSISPNFNFMGQLLEYEHQLRDMGILKHTPKTVQPLPKFEVKAMNKVPKSASSHCVFNPRAEETASQLNANGKREMLEQQPIRPKMLAVGARKSSVGELPSPSTEFGRLSFDNLIEEKLTTAANDCFLSPKVMKQFNPITPSCSSTENPCFFKELPKIQKKSFCILNTLKKTFSHNRPENLATSGMFLQGASSSLTTTVEEAESPESGFGFQDELKQTPEDDRQSISSASSLEITCS